jgi:hypothetical protein
MDQFADCGGVGVSIHFRPELADHRRTLWPSFFSVPSVLSFGIFNTENTEKGGEICGQRFSGD